jgi:hypothetical protein
LSVDADEAPSGRVRGLPPPPRPLQAVPVPVAEAPAGESVAMQSCPCCGQRVRQDAGRCRFCGEALVEEDERPWEDRRKGRLRRDCEPHRAPLILILGIFSLVGLSLPPIGLGLGIAAWLMGQTDLRQMRQRVMDPEGKASTRAGMNCGMIGTVLNGLVCLGCAGLFVLRILHHR